jgi:glycosyltransferase involved in cell wall biosynthesis
MRFCFFAERQVGLNSFAAAIEPYIRAQGHQWRDVTYVEQNGIIERLPLPRRVAGTMRGFLQVLKTLQRERYDALLFMTHNPAVFHQAAIAKIPTVLWTDVTPTLLDLQAAHYDHPTDRFPPVQWMKTALVRSTFQRAALCLGFSEWARASFVRDYGVAVNRTAVVRPGIDLDRWRAQARVPNPVTPRILFVGGNFERKGGKLLLDVFRTYLRGRVELDLVTRDPVPKEPGVNLYQGLTIASRELFELYRTASMFVLPTLADCSPMAALEAMAMGLPVVISDVGGICDMVEPGRSGYLINSNDGSALRSAIEELLADPSRRAAFGARGRAIVEQRFSAKTTAQCLTNLLAQCARARSTVRTYP